MLGIVGLAVGAAAGCSPRLRPIPAEGQVLIEKGRGLLAHLDEITVTAADVRNPPIASQREYIAFSVGVQNNGQDPAVIDPGRMRLGFVAGDERIERAPINPDDLARAYQTASVNDGDRVIQVVEPELARYSGYCGRGGYGGYRCYGPRYYGYHGYSYGCYPFAYGYYPYSYDYYAYPYYYSAADVFQQQQETASFLARLLRPQMLAKDTVADGFVVFGQRAEKKDRYILTIPVQVLPPGSEAVTQPAMLPPGRDLVFEFQYLAK